MSAFDKLLKLLNFEVPPDHATVKFCEVHWLTTKLLLTFEHQNGENGENGVQLCSLAFKF